MPLPIQSVSNFSNNPDINYDDQGRPHITVRPLGTGNDNGIPSATPVQVSPDQIKALADKYSGKTETPSSNIDIKSLADKYKSLPDSPSITSGPMLGNRPLNPEEITPSAANPPTPVVPRSTQILNATKEAPGNVASAIGSAVAENYQSGLDTAKSGLSDISEGNLAPKLPTANPADWQAGGVLKTVGGALGAIMSPISGTVKATVQDPLTEMTANPDFGEKAGLLVSGAIPFAKGVKAVKGAIPSNKAISTLVDAVGVDNLPTFIKDLDSNPRLNAMDVSNSVQQLGQKLVVTPGENQNILSNAIKDRMDETKGTIKGAVDNTMGPPVDVKQKIDSMKAKARETGQKVINPVLEQTGPVDTSAVVKYIDDKAKPGINSVVSTGEQLPSGPIIDRLNEIKSYLTDGKSVLTDPNRLNRIQSSLRSEAENLINSPDGQSRSMGYAVMQLRNKIVDAIDEASPKNANGENTYRKALGSYADDKQVEDAFQKGTEILKNRSSNFDDRPEYWKAWIDDAKPAEIASAKEGARIAVDQQIRGMRNAVGKKGVEIPEVEFNVDKMRLLFGKDKADEMFKALKDEKRIADTNNKLFQNSQTAMRLKSDERVKVREPISFSDAGKTLIPAGIAEAAGTYLTGEPGITTAVLAAGAIAKKTANLAGRKLDLANNAELAKVLSATGADKKAVINKLAPYIRGAPIGIKQNTINLLSGVIGKP